MKVDVVKTGQQLRGADLYYRFCRFSKLINKDKKKKEVEKSSKSIRSGKSLAMSRWAKPLACWEKRDQSWGKNSISPSLFWPIWQENMPTSLGAISQVSTAGLGPHLACTHQPHPFTVNAFALYFDKTLLNSLSSIHVYFWRFSSNSNQFSDMQQSSPCINLTKTSPLLRVIFDHLIALKLCP